MTIAPFRKSYAGATALDFPGAPLPAGQTCAVIGANGSGKSTLAKVTAGVTACGQPQVLSPPVSVGYLPQHSYPFQMTVRANLMLNAPRRNDPARQRADMLLERLEIAHLSEQKAHHLSGGETARMVLARLLMRRYDLLILDEPTAAMDIRSTALTEQLVADYQAETGCGVLWITHSLKQAVRIADTVLFLCRGRLAEAGPAERLLTAPQTSELRQFLDFYGV